MFKAEPNIICEMKPIEVTCPAYKTGTYNYGKTTASVLSIRIRKDISYAYVYNKDNYLLKVAKIMKKFSDVNT